MCALSLRVCLLLLSRRQVYSLYGELKCIADEDGCRAISTFKLAGQAIRKLFIGYLSVFLHKQCIGTLVDQKFVTYLLSFAASTSWRTLFTKIKAEAAGSTLTETLKLMTSLATFTFPACRERSMVCVKVCKIVNIGIGRLRVLGLASLVYI